MGLENLLRTLLLRLILLQITNPRDTCVSGVNHHHQQQKKHVDNSAETRNITGQHQQRGPNGISRECLHT